jgi:flagellar hook-associated protein 1
MPGLIQGLEIARRALLAQQAALNVTANNVANVATPGYTRQTAELEPTTSEQTTQGLVGTGVKMAGIQRARDVFLDTQMRIELGESGRWEARSGLLQHLESVLSEPGETGLSSLLDQFWNSWSDLSNQPEDSAARAVVVQRGQALAEGLKSARMQVQTMVESTDTDIQQRVESINSTLQELARLNSQIARAEVGGGVEANLRDQRDLILDQLAKDAGATHLVRKDGTVVVRMGGRTVVDGDSVTPLIDQTYNDQGVVRVRVLFASDQTPPSFLSGSLSGLMEVRDQALPQFLSQLDQLASTLAGSVNRLHEAGPSHLSFFRGSNAGDLEVLPDVANDPSQVNAGTSGDSGDNDIALAIAALRDSRVMNRSTATMDDFYRAGVASIGSLSAQAKTASDNQSAAVQSLESQRQSAIGVNLDEELTHMVTTQKAYEAAARIFTTIGDMFDTLLRM